MDSLECIEQKGIVKEVFNKKIVVTLTSFSACAHCHSKSACSLYEGETKEIEATASDQHLEPGDKVTIQMKKNLGIHATLLAYILPLLIIMLALIVFTSVGLNDLLTGIFSLLSVAPYFILLYFRRKTLRKTFSFSLRKE